MFSKGARLRLVAAGRHFEDILEIYVRLVKSHHFLVYEQLWGDTPRRDAATVLGICGRCSVGDAAGDCVIHEKSDR